MSVGDGVGRGQGAESPCKGQQVTGSGEEESKNGGGCIRVYTETGQQGPTRNSAN